MFFQTYLEAIQKTDMKQLSVVYLTHNSPRADERQILLEDIVR